MDKECEDDFDCNDVQDKCINGSCTHGKTIDFFYTNDTSMYLQ